MGTNHLLFGRNVFKEAVAVKANIKEIYFENDSSRKFAEEVLSSHRVHCKMKQGLPKELRDNSHQGLGFTVEHDFYLKNADITPKDFPFILLCNHLEDVQNLGAITRSAAAFGVSLLIHEDMRSAQLTPTAIKVSAGQAFRMKFMKVGNLVNICRDLKESGYFLVGLEAGGRSIWEWEPTGPLALVMGSEEKGIAKPVRGQLEEFIEIPMAKGVESLNVSVAAAIAMGTASHKAQFVL